MSITPRKIARASIIGLMLAVAPVASAAGQEAEPIFTPLVPQEQPGGMVEIGQAAIERVDALQAEAEAARRLDEEAAALRPGEFLWKPELSPRGAVEIVVSLEQQKAYVYRAGKLIAVSTVSTGRRGNRTPTGSFTILQKARRHFSNLYNNAPMPNMQRLTWDGIALHAGQLPGYPASHGCVRLPMEFSRLLFDVTNMGGKVYIVADSPPSATAALAFATGRSAGIQLAAR